MNAISFYMWRFNVMIGRILELNVWKKINKLKEYGALEMIPHTLLVFNIVIFVLQIFT